MMRRETAERLLGQRHEEMADQATAEIIALFRKFHQTDRKKVLRTICTHFDSARPKD